MLVVVVLFSAGMLWGVLWGRDPEWVAVAAMVLPVGWLVAFFFLAVWREAARWVSVYPYFQSGVGGIKTFASGYAIARHLPRLDAVAETAGVRTLSSFGWNDDWRGEELVWHAPQAGLEVTACLIEAVEADADSFGHNHPVLNELRAIHEALGKARTKEIMWCLLLRHSNMTSAMEWEKRVGTAF